MISVNQKKILFYNHIKNISHENLYSLYEYYVSTDFLMEYDSEFREILHSFLTTNMERSGFNVILLFVELKIINNIEALAHIENSADWTSADGIMTFIEKVTTEEAKSVKKLLLYDFPFYKKYQEYPLIDHCFSLCLEREFDLSISDDYYDSVQFLLDNSEDIAKRFAGKIDGWCKANFEKILEKNDIEIMKLSPKNFNKYFFKKIEPKKMLKLIYRGDIRANYWEIHGLIFCDYCSKAFDGYYFKTHYNQYCSGCFKKIEPLDYNIIKNQNYELNDEVLILNYICRNYIARFEEIKKNFPETWYFMDLSLYSKFNNFRPLLGIECWLFVHLHERAPLMFEKEIIEIKKSGLKYTREFIRYCYLHLSETIPQDKLLKFCGY
jgi:hypothetical protein